MTPTGTVTEFEVPTAAAYPASIVSGPDGNLWFLEGGSFKVGRVSPAGAITEFSIPGNTRPIFMTVGPDDALWFTDGLFAIWRMSLSGSFTRFSTPTSVFDIAAGADGNLWFTTESPPGQIGRITPGGSITLYSLSTGAWSWGCALGPDGNIWFTTFDTAFGRITPSGTITRYPFPPSPATFATSVATGTDGNLWMPAHEESFCMEGGCTPERDGVLGVRPDGSANWYGFPPGILIGETSKIVAGPDRSLWLTAYGGLVRFSPVDAVAFATIPTLGVTARIALVLLLAVTGFVFIRRG